MKALARMYVWWPDITTDIEVTVRQCPECQVHQATPPQAPLQPWSWPSCPWSRPHLDYAGPVNGKMYLVLIDAHSKWIEAFCTASSTSAAVIAELRPLFALFGLPETVVTDNGTCFVSAEFEEFLASNGNLTSAPYHSASNGLAERAVQIVKKGLKKTTDGSVRARLAKSLFAYRITPQTTTGLSPSEMLLGRRPRSRLDVLKPHTADRVERKQWSQKAKHDYHAKSREFKESDCVFVRNYHAGAKWLPGIIVEKAGPVSYKVELTNGQERRCHQDQVRIRSVELPDITEPEESQEPIVGSDSELTSTEPVTMHA